MIELIFYKYRKPSVCSDFQMWKSKSAIEITCTCTCCICTLNIYISIFSQSLWTIVGAILHMGEIQYEGDEEGKAQIVSKDGEKSLIRKVQHIVYINNNYTFNILISLPHSLPPSIHPSLHPSLPPSISIPISLHPSSLLLTLPLPSHCVSLYPSIPLILNLNPSPSLL